MSKLNFIERCLARLEGGDKAALLRIQKAGKNAVDKQIKRLNGDIDDLKDDIKDCEDRIQETVDSPDLDKCKTSTAAKEYVLLFISNINNHFNTVVELEDQIEEKELQLERYKQISKNFN